MTPMKFEDRVAFCHVSGCIYRLGNPSMKYNKNHRVSLAERVPKSEQAFDDWVEYDREEERGHY